MSPDRRAGTSRRGPGRHPRVTGALSLAAVALAGCATAAVTPPGAGAGGVAPWGSVRVYQTSMVGDALADRGAIALTPAGDGVPTVWVDPAAERQTVLGFGGSFTPAAAAVLGALPPARRAEVIARYFGPDGARYSLTRTPIGSCDFDPRGRWGYAEAADLSDFSVQPDEDDGLLPLIRDAQAASVDGFQIIASPWTAPPFMKEGATKGGGWFGGRLREAHYPTFAAYIARYVEAYRARGVDIWAVTPTNEPLGNDGNWESMHFSPAEVAAWIKADLGPAMQRLGVRILAFDQNRAEAPEWAAALLGDPGVARFVAGLAVHWYGSTYEVYGDVLDALHRAWPDKIIVNSEATIDAIWDDPAEWDPPAPVGAQAGHVPARILYWKDWSWWWQVRATDWGYRWARPEDKAAHPRYSAAARYIRDLVGGLNHWLVGWVDWNLALDKRGGPNHVGNFCGAPVMVDTASGEVFYTPLYFVMSHFSRFIRPGARVLHTRSAAGLMATAARNPDGTVAVVVANVPAHPKDHDAVVGKRFTLRVGDAEVTLDIPAHAIQTVVVAGGPGHARP